jgi:hypothetical protein
MAHTYLKRTAQIIGGGVGIFSSYIGYQVYDAKQTIRDVEKKYNSKVLIISNRDDKLKYGIIPYVRNNLFHHLFRHSMIDVNDDEKFKKVFHQNDDKTIKMLIKSPGGSAQHSTNILNILKHHPHKIEAYVPEYALSAATLLVLASSHIFMQKYATLSPTDPQTTLVLDNIGKIRLSFPILDMLDLDFDSSINLKMLALKQNVVESKMFYDENIMFITNYLQRHKKSDVSTEKINELVDFFSSGNNRHNHEINSNFLENYLDITIGIPTDMQKIYDILSFLFDTL